MGADLRPGRGQKNSTGGAFPNSRTFKDGARGWLLEQSAGVGTDSDPGLRLRLAQRCFMLDEASSLELVREIMAIQMSDDAELKKAFKGIQLGDLLDAATFRLAQLNPDAAMEVLEGSPEHLKELAPLVFSNIAAENLDDADRFLQRMPALVLRDAIEPVAAKLALTDPAAAVSLLEEYPGPELDSERRKLVERLVAKDPGKGMAVAVKFANDGRNPDVIRAAVQSWLTVDEKAATQWAAGYRGPGEAELRDFLQKRPNP